MNTYTTKSGDMWDNIAKTQLGSEKYMTALINANEKYSDVVIFGANITLNIPQISTPIPEYLPPWRR